MPKIEITMLSTMAGEDFPAAVQRQADLGLRLLDLKDGLWGKTIEQLTPAEAVNVQALCAPLGLGVYCYSTSIGRAPLPVGPAGEKIFRERFQPAVERVLKSLPELPTTWIRLLVPQVPPSEVGRSMAYIQENAPWVFTVYRDWIDALSSAGPCVLLENEVNGCVFSTVSAIESFFSILDRGQSARYTWDVQNLWQTGTFPTTEVYNDLRPWIGALHLKGGRSEGGSPLKIASNLESASWPVREVVGRVIREGKVPVLCLNPSHGRKSPQWDIWQTGVEDLNFLRREFPEIR